MKKKSTFLLSRRPVNQKNRFLLICGLFAVLIFMNGCFRTIMKTNSTEKINADTLQTLINAQKYFILHYRDQIVGLKNPAVSADQINSEIESIPEVHKKYLHPEGKNSVAGKIPDKQNVGIKKAYKMVAFMEVHIYTMDSLQNKKTVSLPLSSVYRTDIYEFNKSATTANHILSWVGIAAGIVLAAALPFALACNCPQVFVENNGVYNFEGGVYSGAVYSTLERSDYLPLPNINSIENNYTIKIGNVPDEEQFINEIKLLAVEHPADIQVLADRHGKILNFSNQTIQPVEANGTNGQEQLQKIITKDSTGFSFDNAANSEGFSAIELKFIKPEGAKSAKLLVHAGNSQWSGYLNKEFASLFGEDYTKWRIRQESAETEHPEQWQVDQSIPLKVYVETNSGWKYVDYFNLTGNTASRDMVMELDLSAVSSEIVHIKLETVYRFWELDQVSIDFTPTLSLNNNIIKAGSIFKNGITPLQNELAEKDPNYVHLENNEYLQIVFDRSKIPVNSSLFLISTGYYHNLKKFTGKANLGQLAKFRGKGYFDKFSREKYRNMETIMAMAKAPE